MADHDIRSDVRLLRFTVERIDRELAGHIRQGWKRSLRSAEDNGRLQGRLDRIEASLAALGTLIKRLEAQLERRADAARD